MAKKDDGPDTERDLPPIPELTEKHANRIVCADYLRQVAMLIEQGAVTAFDFVWLSTQLKPQGKLVTNSTFLVGPSEAKLMRAVAEHKAKSSIQVVDATEELKGHQPCSDEYKDQCALCNTKLS